MDRKEAVLRIKNHMEHHGIGKYPHLKLKEALDMAIAALSPPNEPLTLEQLRRMDGQPVWCRDKDEWFIIELHHPVFGSCVINSDGCYITLEKAAKRGFYAHPRAHIDREGWTADWVKHDGYTECSKCDYWYDSPDGEEDGDRPVFCPACGRAMTPEAWAELEKRVRG